MDRDQTNEFAQMDRAELQALGESLDAQLKDAEAKLGAALYPLTKDDTTYAADNKDLYDALAKLYQQEDALQKRLEQIRQEEEEARRRAEEERHKAEDEAKRAAEASASQSFECPNCHTILEPGDKFCTGCGMPRADVIAGQKASSALTCPNCHTILEPGDKFCFNCGHKLV